MLTTLTGRTEIVADLSHLWVTAEKLHGGPIDPLSPQLIAALEAGDG